MVLRVSLLFVLTISLLACKQEVEQKGGEIPSIDLHQNPINYQKQITYLSSLIAENEQPQLLFYRARAYFNIHQYLLAKQDLDRLYNQTNDMNQEYLLLNAWVSLRLGEHEKALELLKLSPFYKNNTLESLPLFFELYAEKRMLNSLKSTFNQMKIQSVSSPDFMQVASLLLSGDTLTLRSFFAKNQLKNYQDDFVNKAYLKYAFDTAPVLQYQKICLELLKMYPFDGYYLLHWARFLSKMGKIDQAEKVFVKSAQLLPNNQEVEFAFAKFYFQSRNYSKSLAYFTKIDNKHPNFQEAQYHRAICLLFLGKKIEAQSTIDSLALQYPISNQWVKRFYTNFLRKNDSTSITQDSLSNFSQ